MSSQENNDSIVDTSNLARDDLLDAYDKLAIKYVTQKQENDCLNQKLHLEISQKKVLENTLLDAQSELDSINDVYLMKIQQVERRNEEFKHKCQCLEMEKTSLENKIDDLDGTIEKLKCELQEVKCLLAVKTIKPRVSDTYAKSLEIENENLRSTIHEIKEQLEELSIKFAERTSQAEELKERLVCTEDNFQSKKSELEEKIEIMEHLQEKVHELSTELTLLKSSEQDDNNRKGNSLFAEVDDQRQKMKKILQGERAHYLQMKKAYNSKEIEIRRLKRENLNIKAEIQACNNQLKRGEQLSSSHMKIYVSSLESDKRNLEVQLKEMEQKLIDLAKDQKMFWIETLLTTSSKEARDLKDKQYVLLREKTLLADNHSKTLKDLARARLESIKLKALLGRVVDNYKIKLDEAQYFDLGIDEGIFDNLKLEEYETIDSNDTFDDCVKDETLSGMLNESTIVLLGGRDKLGNAIPCMKQKTHENSSFSYNEAIDSKEIKQEIKLEKTDVPAIDDEINEKSTELAAEKENLNFLKPKAISEKSSKVQSPAKSKSIQFSNKIETRIIDKTKEEFEQSKEARKRPAFTVTRIFIPSKTPKTS